MTTFNFHRFKN